MKFCISFSVSLICFTSCAVAAPLSNRARARNAENSKPRKPRRPDTAYPFRMSDMAWSSISTHCLQSHNFGRGMTATARAPMLTPMFTLMLCNYRYSGVRSAYSLCETRRTVDATYQPRLNLIGLARRGLAAHALRQSRRCHEYVLLTVLPDSFPIALTEHAPPQSVCAGTAARDR